MRMGMILSLAATAIFATSVVAPPAAADGLSLVTLAKSNNKAGGPGGGSGGSGGGTTSPTYYSWMSPDINSAWGAGFFGQGASMTFVDDFSSTTKYFGNLGDGLKRLRHGEWTSKEATMLAPSATLYKKDFSTDSTPITLQNGFNVVNASYGWVDQSTNYSSDWTTTFCNCAQEQSIIDAATNGTAVISKAAGNDSVSVGTALSDGSLDFLDKSLIGTQSAIFVGALDFNGTKSNPAPLSYYSDTAGTDPAVQSHFLVVGVDYNTTGLAGTSFAAPVITAYASILHSKFTSATPVQVVNQLLSTARTDTVQNYNVATYGMGEASLANALAPSAIQ